LSPPPSSFCQPPLNGFRAAIVITARRLTFCLPRRRDKHHVTAYRFLRDTALMTRRHAALFDIISPPLQRQCSALLLQRAAVLTCQRDIKSAHYDGAG